MSIRNDGTFQRPESIAEFERHEESMERRQEAMARHRRQQFELFEIESDPGCGNCGEVGGEPVGASYDRSEQACSLCVKGAKQ